VYIVIDELLWVMQYHNDERTKLNSAESLTVTVVVAKELSNHHERALYLLVELGHMRALSMPWFNRRLHALRGWLWQAA
jgi:hypothetical protein